MSKSTLDVTTLQFDDTGNPITLTSSLNNLDLEGTAAADVTVSGVTGITATNDLTIISGNTTNQGTFANGSVLNTINTAGNVAYTAAQVYNGTILRDPNGANRTDTFPTAASLIALINDAVDNISFTFRIVNTATVYEYITLAAGTGITITGKDTVGEGEVAHFVAVVTSVGSNTVTIYNVGSSGGTNKFIALAGTINNAPQSNFRYCQWGITVGTQASRVNNVIIGYDGIIRAASFTFLNGTAITISGTDTIQFDIGSTSGDPNSNNFTAFTGGNGVVSWDISNTGTWPVSTINNLSLSFTSTTQIAVRSDKVPNGTTITPTSADVNVCLIIELL